jgi:hypothetical protein
VQNWLGLLGLIISLPLTYVGVVRLSLNREDRVGRILILIAVAILLVTLSVAVFLSLRD